MNNGQQGQPSGAQGNPQAQPPRKINIFRPENMRSLPEQFSQEEKQKWEAGLKNLWAQVQDNAPETTAHQDAKRKLYDFSRTLTAKLHNARAQQQQQVASAGAARPPSQGQPTQQTGESAPPTNAAQPTQQPTTQQIPEKLLNHVNSFPYVAPGNLAVGSPEALQWIKEWKMKYLRALTTMDSAATRLTAMKEIHDKRVEEGRPYTAEEEIDYREKQGLAKKQHGECKNFVENFRKQQEGIKNATAGNQGNSAQPQASGANAGGSTNANTNAGGNGNVPNPGQVPAPQRPQMSVNQPATNPTLQHTQTINGAIETARNQQMNGGRPAMQISLPPQPQTQQQMANQSNPANMNMGNPNMGQTNIKTEPVAPAPINTSAAMQMQQRGSIGGQGMPTASPQSAAPRSAQSAGHQGQNQVPQALSHTDALNHAARSYSNTAPSVMGHSHPNLSIPRDQNVTTNKMPIPKHLPERATQAPQPVSMPSVRPSYTGGANSIGGGVMNQPIINNPSNNGAPSGENEGILTSNKLNELVRQVTGGGNGLDGGQGLSPDVEKSVLEVADTFVDQVLQAACKNAKERGSKILEIRDIQLTLERGYNIRIPGYSSDEIRTVRKITPAAGWISKMSAVQAAKVTGGRNVD